MDSAVRSTVVACSLALSGCSTFHTRAAPIHDDAAADAASDARARVPDATVSDGGTPPDARPADAPLRDAGSPDATVQDARRADAARPDVGATDAVVVVEASRDATSVDAADASPVLDTACDLAWSDDRCSGRWSTSIGTLQGTDDPRVGLALSAGGTIGLCYADDPPQEFLSRELHAVTFPSPTARGSIQGTPNLLFMSTYSDTTSVCAIAGASGSTFHVLVYDSENDVVDYGLIEGSAKPSYTALGPGPVVGYVSLGLAPLPDGGVLAAVGTGIGGTITSYTLTGEGGDGGVGPAVPVEQVGRSASLPGAGQFSLRPAPSPMMLIDMEPGDAAGSRADLATFDGTRWAVRTLEGSSLDAAVGYSPSLAITDGGYRAVYYLQIPIGDGGTSQIHIASGGGPVQIASPIAAVSDPMLLLQPAVGAAAAVGPDGRLFIAYVAPATTGTSGTALYLARPESTLPGALLVTDTVDDRLTAEDATSVNLLVEPSGRVDIAYMRVAAGSVYYATLDP